MTLPEIPTGAEGIFLGAASMAAGLIAIAYISRPHRERIWPLLLCLACIIASYIWGKG